MKTREILRKLRPSPVTVILLGLIVYLWFRPPAWITELDRPAPDVPVEPGQRLADLRGQVLLINFWATWCPYCRHEMPAMQSFYDDWRHCGFEIIAYSLDEEAGTVTRFMRDKGYAFPAPLAAPGVTAAFGGVDRLPTSYVVDRAGRIRHKISGQVHYARLQKLVAPLLKPCSPRF
ncbi:MAG: TlpA family protein disulfide reductase [Thiobacillaceae bacterium]